MYCIVNHSILLRILIIYQHASGLYSIIAVDILINMMDQEREPSIFESLNL